MRSQGTAAITAVGLAAAAFSGAWLGPSSVAAMSPYHFAAKAAKAAPKPAPKPQDSDDVRPATQSERKAVISSIKAQLDAFKQDDFARAATFQSAALRKNFPSLDAFRAMIKASYPQFARYKSVAFGEAVAAPDGKHVGISATLTGQDDATVRAVYVMALENKVYRIEGVETSAAQPNNPVPDDNTV